MYFQFQQGSSLYTENQIFVIDLLQSSNIKNKSIDLSVGLLFGGEEWTYIRLKFF